MLRYDMPPLFVDNGAHLSAFVLEGEKDDDVRPFHPPLMAALLRGTGSEVVYREVAGQGHWWDDDPQAPGVGCLDHPEMMEFLQRHVRDPNPAHVVFETTNPGMDGQAYGTEVTTRNVGEFILWGGPTTNHLAAGFFDRDWRLDPSLAVW
ncbi:MAG: hypothetical protein AB1505_16235 [Candidatus Latescibacterota bacterium]